MDLLWQWMKEDLALALRAPLTRRVYLASARAFFLLEAGADLRVIQALLGHVNSGFTAHYLQVSTQLLAKAPNPLDELLG